MTIAAAPFQAASSRAPRALRGLTLALMLATLALPLHPRHAAAEMGPAAADASTPRPAVSGYDYMAASTKGLQDDDFINPGFLAVAEGQRLWATPAGSEGRSCASCHGADGGAMAGVATRYPKVDAETGVLENLEGRINRCRTEHLAAPALRYESDDLLALTTFVTERSRGMAMSVAIDGPAAAHFAQGRALYFQRRGQLDLACAHCHNDRPGQRLRGDVISQGQINGFPIYRLKWGKMGSRHRMFAWCNTSLRAEPFELGGPEYLALELYVAWRGNGLVIETPAVRR